MKLTNAQILTLAKGYMEYAETPALALQRFSKKQREIYSPGDKGYLSSNFTSSVRLDFYTDAEEMTLVIGGYRRKPLKYTAIDLLQDGVLTHRFHADFEPMEGSEAVAIDPIVCHAKLKNGEKRVTVYLPYLVVATMESMELSDGAAFRPAPNKSTWIAFGDSITNGTRAACPSMTYVNHTARLLDMDVHNFGIGGERFMESKIVPGTYPKCDLVTISYGTNDYRRYTREEFLKNMSVFLEKAVKEFQNVPIFVILPIWRQTEADGISYDCGTLQSIRDAIRAEAKKYPSVTVLDAQSWVPQIPEFFADLVLHPNDAGFAHYTMHLVEELKKAGF